jgi:hypothetical protein
MREQRLTFTTPSHTLTVLIITSAVAIITQAKASEKFLPSSYPVVDIAAWAFAEGRRDVAVQEFEKISQDESIPSFARGLALFGLADVALARQDFNAAIAALERLTGDKKLLWFHRETAKRRIAEVERLKKGLPARDSISYRVKLPVFPTPGTVFYVSPTGDDTGDGSQKEPFRTLERARDAVRSLKQSRSGTLPEGGVKIVINGGDYKWEKTLKLTSADSGTTDKPIVYQVEPGRTAIFHSGVRITEWKTISDAKLRDKLDVRIRNRVLEADLKTTGIGDRGFGGCYGLASLPGAIRQR